MKIKILMMLVVAFFIVDIKAMDTKKENSVDYFFYNDNWELVKTENGINVFVSNYSGADGVLKLKVKFENTNSKEVDLKCEITNKSSETFHQEFNISLKANSSVEYVDATAPILINESQTKQDFIINFK